MGWQFNQKGAIVLLGSLLWLAPTCYAQTNSFQFTATNYIVTRTSSGILVTVQRTPGSAVQVSSDVTYSTHNGTARAGVDFVSKSGTLQWHSFELCEKSFFVPKIGNTTTNISLIVSLTSGPTKGPTGVLYSTVNYDIFVQYNGSIIRISPRRVL
jgi:hypothetical protein